MRQFAAVLLDSYRDLQARKLFWIVIILSMAGIILFGIALRVDGNDLVFFTAHFPLPPFRGISARTLYKQIFYQGVIGFWLTWVSTILALVSTAGIFPDFITGGAIDLYLSKPISRLRLFWYKFVGGLLFVTLQVTLFCIIGFFALGWRAGAWMPGLFLAVPIVLVFYSYLFSLCVFFGVLTRSTIAALLLTMLAWLGFFAISTAETTLLTIRTMNEMSATQSAEKLRRLDNDLRRAEAAATMPIELMPAPTPEDLTTLRAERAELARAAAGDTTGLLWLRRIQDGLYVVKTVLPKTTDTVGLLGRILISDLELAPPAPATRPEEQWRRDRQEQQQAKYEASLVARHRSVWWIVGTSLLFEAGVLGLAAWVFCRRDY